MERDCPPIEYNSLRRDRQQHKRLIIVAHKVAEPDPERHANDAGDLAIIDPHARGVGVETALDADPV